MTVIIPTLDLNQFASFFFVPASIELAPVIAAENGSSLPT